MDCVSDATERGSRVWEDFDYVRRLEVRVGDVRALKSRLDRPCNLVTPCQCSLQLDQTKGYLISKISTNGVQTAYCRFC
jgi:hypothetical protein